MSLQNSLLLTFTSSLRAKIGYLLYLWNLVLKFSCYWCSVVTFFGHPWLTLQPTKGICSICSNMFDPLKSLVYLMCLFSCLEGYGYLITLGQPFANDRLFGFIGITIKLFETVLGFFLDALNLKWSPSEDTEDHPESEDETSADAEESYSLTSSASVPAFLSSFTSDYDFSVIWETLKYMPLKFLRLMEFLGLGSLVLFFAGEYHLPLISYFLKTSILASLLGLWFMYEDNPLGVELITNAFFPAAMTAMVAVSSLGDNGHLFWAVFNTVFFDKFSEVGKFHGGSSYNSAVTLNFFVNAVKEVALQGESHKAQSLIPLTETYYDIYVAPNVTGDVPKKGVGLELESLIWTPRVIQI